MRAFNRTPRLVLAVIAATLAGAAQATLITFDERRHAPQPPGDMSWNADPIGDFYDPLGVDIHDGYLRPAGGGVAYDASQFLLGGPTFRIEFTGSTLPTFVSLSFTSPFPNFPATVTARGPGDYVASADTGGIYWDENGQPYETPFNAHSVANFHSPLGIARLDFGAVLTRNIGQIDNLYFGHVAPVPEPAPLALAGVGALVLALAHRRRRAVGQPSVSAQMLSAQPSA